MIIFRPPRALIESGSFGPEISCRRLPPFQWLFAPDANHTFNRRLIAADAMGITFKCKDYRIQGPERYKLMTLAIDEFIRRFLMHALPKGFHCIRHYGLLANGSRADNVAKARALLNVPRPDAIPDDPKSADAAEPPTLSRPCPCCGGRMLIVETFARGCEPKYRPATAPFVIRIDTS